MLCVEVNVWKAGLWALRLWATNKSSATAKMNFSLLVFVASQVGAVLKEAYYTTAVC